MRAVVLLLGWGLLFVSPANAANDTENVYKAHCLACHGANGEGSAHAAMKIKPADLRSDAVQKSSDEELYNSIAFGVKHKEYPHAFAERGLTLKQISELVTYIRSFGSHSRKNK